jgi:hypothetical protein
MFIYTIKNSLNKGNTKVGVLLPLEPIVEAKQHFVDVFLFENVEMRKMVLGNKILKLHADIWVY